MSKAENSKKSAVPPQLQPYAFPKGVSGNPGGRPRTPLKDFQRELFAAMTTEEKIAFLKKISPDIRWKMAEGNPESEIVGAGGKDFIPRPNEKIKKLTDELKKVQRRGNSASN